MPTLNPMRNLSLASLLLVASLASAAGASPAAAPEKAGADSKPTEAGKLAPESLLKKGMSLDEVRQVMGKPDEIRPMEVATGKAAIWTYKRQVADKAAYVQVGSKVITITIRGTDGVERQQTVGEEPDFRMQHRITEDLIQLLMFNDHFVEKKVTRQERNEFH